MILGYFYSYTHYKENNDKNISIYILKNFKYNFTIDTMFWSLFSLEKHLIKKRLMIFHCSYINYKNHTVLFSGTSGMEKST